MLEEFARLGVQPRVKVERCAGCLAEVEWVHQNMVLVIEYRGSKPPKLHWERAQKPPPSHGARNLMEFAATNRAGFMKIVQSLRPGMGSDEEMMRREKVRIEEIRRVLEELREIQQREAL